MSQSSIFALVLAGGDGTRLRSLTTLANGECVPKQFWSLRGGSSLLARTVERAARFTDAEHTLSIVTESHRQWWAPELARLPAANVIVQPANRGTGLGVLLPLLTALERDRQARVVLLPSDHYVRGEDVLTRGIRQALEASLEDPERAILLGFEPDEPDTGLGYILPSTRTFRGLSRVARFVEKPTVDHAWELMARGALWNSFILVSTASALLEIFRLRIPRVLEELQPMVRAGDAAGALADLYGRVASIDFSRGILQGQEARLRVLRVGACGWTDLGTPARVESALSRAPNSMRGEEAYLGAVPAPSLAEQRLRGLDRLLEKRFDQL